MNNDLISREALKKAVQDYANDQYDAGEYMGEYTVLSLIDNAPTVEPRIEYGTDGQPYKLSMTNGKEYERPKGEWKKLYGNHTYCSRCKKDCEQNHINFCGYCGADMR